MRILVVHNRYRSAVPSGENRVVESEIRALAAAGVDVHSYVRDSDEIDGLSAMGKLRAAGSPVWSPRAVREVTAELERHRSDVLHLHNPYPLISLAVVRAAHALNVAVVQTAHNHRHVCMSGSHLRDGKPCHDCLGGRPWPGVLHGCYRGSRSQSAVMGVALAAHRGTRASIDRHIALTEDIAASLRRAGIPAARIVVRPNSVPDPGRPAATGQGAVLVGRVTEEKGCLLLAAAWAGWPDGSLGPLTVVGDGPAMARMRQMLQGRGDVVFTGRLDAPGVHDAMRRSAAVLIPSIAAEAQPLVALEALASGRALLVSDVGGLPSLVPPEIGWVVRPNEASWHEALGSLRGDLAAMGQRARASYLRTFTDTQVVESLLTVYRAAVAERAGARAVGREASA